MTPEGLRQGCPLSATLFTLYIAELETKLLDSGLGFQVQKKGNFWDVRENKFTCIPGLLFADDLVLMARMPNDLQTLLSIASDFGNQMQLQFNPRKRAVVVFSPTGENAQLQSKAWICLWRVVTNILA